MNTFNDKNKYLESKMSTDKTYPKFSISNEKINMVLPLLEEAFCNQALIGNINVTKSEKETLFYLANKALDRALADTSNSNFGLNRIDCDILVLETVLLLREWNEQTSSTKNVEDTTFWEFICNQYSFSYDDTFGSSKIYKIFKYSISDSLNYHDRLFISSGHKYYTSMLIHAISPKQVFFDFFEQLLAFYAKTLNYQVIESDPIFQKFSCSFYNWIKGMVDSSDENVYIKSVQSSSAIKALFKYCPFLYG